MGVWVEICGSTYIGKIDKICTKREAHMHSSVNGTTHVTTTTATTAAATTDPTVNTNATVAAITCYC